MPTPRRICLVSPSHVAANPRLVKEANALQAAGHSVHVVAGWYFEPLDALDREIYSAATWDRTTVYYVTGPRVLLAKARRKLAHRKVARTKQPKLTTAMRACHPAIGLLAMAAKKIDADLYIGHGIAGLAAAAIAAGARKARYAFDAEDFHSAETTAVVENAADAAIVGTIEAALLPGCCCMTAASPLISHAYSTKYSIDPPVPILNVFPLSEAPAEAPAVLTDPRKPAKLYWFSQTIGPGRGLEQVILTLARMKTHCELYLRGIPAGDFVDDLLGIAATVGFTGKIEILPTAPSSEMARLATHYDLGLSLEQTKPANRDLCLTNKIFTYLLAGLPIALTPTQAQLQLAPELGSSAVMLNLDEPAKAATELDSYFASPLRRATARAEAWRLAQTRFNWEVEQISLLRTIDAVFSHAARTLAILGA
ncbi:hypothetical protein DB347_18350 [Opitutaceae bacterium EW11]|nr:hypothetical protein DB347_18350 [Opitutaceae bacterium EW11]